MSDSMGERFGPYVLQHELGRGGMGVVYLALDEVKQRTVAVKVLARDLADDAEFRARFQRESRIAAQLNDPHVIPIHDFGEIDGRLYLEMRLVRGRDLSELVTDGPLEPAAAVSVVSQIADALDAAHAAGLVHRDVKPANILLAEPDRPGRPPFAYLVDFGIALTGDESARLTTSGMIGTLAYLAPERLLGQTCDGRADVYALGCVLFEALTGRRPFDGETGALVYGHVHLPPPDPAALVPGVPAALAAAVLKAMAKDPGDRFATAGELADAAASAIAGTAVPTEPDRPVHHPVGPDAVTTRVAPDAPTGRIGPTPGRTSSRRRALFAGAAALVVVLAVVIGFVAFGGGDGSPEAGRSGAGTSGASVPAGPRFVDGSTVRAVQDEAEAGIVAFNSYDYRRLGEAKAAALDHVTGKLRSAYLDTFDTILSKDGVRQKVVQRATVSAVGVRAASTTTASALVYGQLDFASSGSAPRKDPIAVTVDLARVDGKWLLSAVSLVTGLSSSTTLASADRSALPGTAELQQAVADGVSCTLRLTTFARATFDADWSRALACTTGSMRTDLGRSRDRFRSTITTGRFDLRAEVVAAGVEKADGRTVTVLVSFAGFRSDKSKPTTYTNARVTVVSRAGRWVLSDLRNIGVA